MRIVITGFDCFGGLAHNSSEFVVKALAASAPSDGGFELVGEVLRTEFAYAGARIRQILQETRPDLCLCLGMAADSQVILLERVALNVDEARQPDNAGVVTEPKPIVRDGPDAYYSTLQLEEMVTMLTKRGLPAVISEFAGTFVCNHVFYSALDEIATGGLPTRCGLIHLPAVQGLGMPGGVPLRDLVVGVTTCLALSCSSM